MESKDLVKTLEALKGEGKPLYIVGHKGVCYDVLGSAFGLAKIASTVGLEAKVCGEATQDWGYPQNNILYNLLELERKISPPSAIPSDSNVAYVDVFPKGTNCYDVKGKTVIVINHHPKEDSIASLEDIAFVDTGDVGSTVAMVAEHMMNLKIELTEADKDLATLMLYGLRVDTKHYLLGNTALDHKVSPFLEQFADLSVIKKIESRSYPGEMLNIMKNLNEKEIGKYRVAVVKMPKVGMVPQLADVLSSFEGNIISLIVAKIDGVGDRDWYISGRSKNSAYNVGELVKEIFGSGGGHWYSGGASLTTKDMYERFKVDESRNTSVLKQILSAIIRKLKSLSNEK